MPYPKAIAVHSLTPAALQFLHFVDPGQPVEPANVPPEYALPDLLRDVLDASRHWIWLEANSVHKEWISAMQPKPVNSAQVVF